MYTCAQYKLQYTCIVTPLPKQRACIYILFLFLGSDLSVLYGSNYYGKGVTLHCVSVQRHLGYITVTSNLPSCVGGGHVTECCEVYYNYTGSNIFTLYRSTSSALPRALTLVCFELYLPVHHPYLCYTRKGVLPGTGRIITRHPRPDEGFNVHGLCSMSLHTVIKECVVYTGIVVHLSCVGTNHCDITPGKSIKLHVHIYQHVHHTR